MEAADHSAGGGGGGKGGAVGGGGRLSIDAGLPGGSELIGGNGGAFGGGGGGTFGRLIGPRGDLGGGLCFRPRVLQAGVFMPKRGH